MKADRALAKLSTLALENRRRGLAINLPRAELTLRGSLLQRYVTCGKPDCKCARGERHGPSWYLTVTLAPGRTNDVLRYSLASFELEPLEQMLVSINRRLKRNKALDPGRVQGRVVATLSLAVEPATAHSSPRRMIVLHLAPFC